MRQHNDSDVRIVTVPEKAKELFCQVHGSNMGGHIGINKTINGVAACFYWRIFGATSSSELQIVAHISERGLKWSQSSLCI